MWRGLVRGSCPPPLFQLSSFQSLSVLLKSLKVTKRERERDGKSLMMIIRSPHEEQVKMAKMLHVFLHARSLKVGLGLVVSICDL